MNEWCIIGGFLDLFICYSNFLNLVLSQLPFPFPELLGSYRIINGESRYLLVAIPLIASASPIMTKPLTFMPTVSPWTYP